MLIPTKNGKINYFVWKMLNSENSLQTMYEKMISTEHSAVIGDTKIGFANVSMVDNHITGTFITYQSSMHETITNGIIDEIETVKPVYMDFVTDGKRFVVHTNFGNMKIAKNYIMANQIAIFNMDSGLEEHQMKAIESKLNTVTKVSFVNPKTSDVQRATIAGKELEVDSMTYMTAESSLSVITGILEFESIKMNETIRKTGKVSLRFMPKQLEVDVDFLVRVYESLIV